MSPAAASERHQIIVSAELIERINEWRRTQPDLPNKSEAIRRLVVLGLEGAKKNGG